MGVDYLILIVLHNPLYLTFNSSQMVFTYRLSCSPVASQYSQGLRKEYPHFEKFPDREGVENLTMIRSRRPGSLAMPL